METDLIKLEGKVNKLSKVVGTHESEINNLRKFRHEANGHLHDHKGKLNLIENKQINIENQQNNMEMSLNKISSILEDAIKKITTLWTLNLEDAIKKITTLWTLKSMIIGGGVVFVPTVTGMIYLFKLYLDSKGLH